MGFSHACTFLVWVPGTRNAKMSGKCPVNRQTVKRLGDSVFCKRLIGKALSHSAPCGTRTHDPRIRNPLLYPAELRALFYGLFHGCLSRNR
jgi:hypothetical protein